MDSQDVSISPASRRKAGEGGADAADLRIGRRLRALRRRLGLSQTEMGRMIGVTFQQIQKYERGLNRVTASRLGALAKCAGIPVCFFFRGAEVALPQEKLCRDCEVSCACAALTEGGPGESPFRNQ